MDEVSRLSTLRRIWTASPTVLCVLVAAVPAAAQTVRGRLVDAESGKPVAAGDILLLSGESGAAVLKQGLTTDSGRFALTAPSPGRYRLKAERIGYRAVVSSPFDLLASEPLDVELKISVQAVPLAPLTVVSSRPALLGSIRLVAGGFFDREQSWGPKGLHLGTFIDKAAIARRQPIRTTDLFKMIPGVILVGNGDKQVVRMSMVTTMNGPCTPLLYLDGTPIRLVDYGGGGLKQVATIDELVNPSSIAGIEVYSKISKPAGFTDMGVEPCGAIVIWTGYAESRGKGGRVAGDASPMLGERLREDRNTRTAERLLDLADTMDDKSAANSFYQQALDAAHAAIAADSTNPLPRLQAGEAAIGVGDYKEADEQLNMAEKLRPIYQLQTQNIREKAWVALQRQATPLVRAGQVDRAITRYEDANIIYRERPEVMLALGQLYSQEGKDDRALANLDSAALIIQDSSKLASVDSVTAADWKSRLPALKVTRAQVLAHADRYDESIADFRKLVQAYPDDLRYKWDLAQLLIQTGKNGEAIRIYDGMLQDSALTAAELYSVGMRLYQLSDYTNAVTGFSRAAGKSPMDQDALEMWVRCLFSDSVYAQVPPVAERWIALDPNNRTAYVLEEQAVSRQGDVQKAQELAKDVQDLKVSVDNLRVVRGPNGGATVTGTVTNEKLASGAQVTITFTFYDDSGNSVGTRSQTATLGAQGQAQSFSVGFNSDARVGGYGYTVTTP